MGTSNSDMPKSISKELKSRSKEERRKRKRARGYEKVFQGCYGLVCVHNGKVYTGKAAAAYLKNLDPASHASVLVETNTYAQNNDTSAAMSVLLRWLFEQAPQSLHLVQRVLASAYDAWEKAGVDYAVYVDENPATRGAFDEGSLDFPTVFQRQYAVQVDETTPHDK